ncbi:hypothetical protein RvY_14875 [Ramazzottius varieornatus]|uniref:DUF659 domain-containing protein n=1 Tax=Ramazzottius varieornatus TaxID=947166 RepID=A0A1D1VWH3_RAMVA|nr:hypothetical protein RvY_14875 [Ramazzottius varieornatus]
MATEKHDEEATHEEALAHRISGSYALIQRRALVSVVSSSGSGPPTFCVKAGAKVLELRGERLYLVKHVLGCVHVPQPVKKPCRAPNTEQPTSGKEQLKARLKRLTTQGSLMGFVDRPLTTSEKSQFERLLANAFLDCVKLPKRITFSQRIVKDRISEAVSEIDTVFSRQPTVTSTFDSFKDVSKNKLLENGTENHIFGKIENITGVSYTGDYVIEQVESALAIMRTKYNGTIQAVTCDSDGTHRKARTDLKKLHPEIISLPCSAHHINLIFQESYAVKFEDNEDYLPGDTKAATGSSKFWDSLKDVLALLRPLVDAQAKAESDDCTLAEIGVCLADSSFLEHSVASERSILLEKLERR